MGSRNAVEPSLVLTSWKEIAHYLGKGVRTVQRWEQDFGLPVRRPAGSRKKAVLARSCELDVWAALRCSTRAESASHRRENFRERALTLVSSLNVDIDNFRQMEDGDHELLDRVQATLTTLREQLISLNSEPGEVPGPTEPHHHGSAQDRMRSKSGAQQGNRSTHTPRF